MKIFGETTPMNKFTRDKVDPLAPAWLCGIAALTLAAPMALSQNAAQSVSGDLVLEEVMVTATKRTEKLQDVPVAVSALTSEDISARGFSQYADYLNTVPGVYFEDLGPGKSQIRIRGLSTAEGGAASTVATYFGEAITSVVTIGSKCCAGRRALCSARMHLQVLYECCRLRRICATSKSISARAVS
jgi:hypothetical protein